MVLPHNEIVARIKSIRCSVRAIIALPPIAVGDLWSLDNDLKKLSDEVRGVK
jgi:hypothetical protein